MATTAGSARRGSASEFAKEPLAKGATYVPSQSIRRSRAFPKILLVEWAIWDAETRGTQSSFKVFCNGSCKAYRALGLDLRISSAHPKP